MSSSIHLLQVQPLEQEAVSVLRAELHPDKSSSDLVQSASHLLSSITAQAGLVTVPRPETNQLRQVEFLPLSGDRVLVILVVNEREVQNRIIHTRRVYTEEELQRSRGAGESALRGPPPVRGAIAYRARDAGGAQPD